jgi:hypothetical protein
MYGYDSYRDILNEHATRRHVAGSSIVIVLLALAAALAAALI